MSLSRRHLLPTVFAALLACGSMQGFAQSAAAPAAPAASSGKTTLSSGDVDFLKKAALAGHAEVEAGNLALNKARSAEVKTFAQQMVTDHTKVGDELKVLATRKNLELPDRNSVKSWAQMKMINAGDDDKFDQRYADAFGVKAHEDTIKLFQKAAADAKDADVKAWAQKTLPGLQHHLQMAQSLKTTVAPAR